MTTGQRIKLRRKELNLSADDIAKVLEVSRSTVFRYEKGDIEKLPIDILEPLAKILQTTPSYLMGWEDKLNNNYENIIPVPDMNEIPLVGSIACGSPILAEENIEEHINIPKQINADFALQCKGDSMINARIFDGDIVYIKNQPDVDNGEIAAVLIENEATLKRVYKYTDKLVLQPENPAYEPLVYVGYELQQIRIIGKAVAFTSLIK